jgi:D-3-phosphoglycerate dehydrogenase / 2-oxoglutarate reductase
MSETTVLVGTETFGVPNPEPRDILEDYGIELRLNPFNRRLTPADYDECLDGVSYVIAGLEPYNTEIFRRYPQIKVLSRIGIGVDSIDLAAAETHGVTVYNTPAAPSLSVAEQTIAFIIALSRGLFQMNGDFHKGLWQPFMGREVSSLTVGLLGFGRIGGMVAERLMPFGCRLIGHDPCWDNDKASAFSVKNVPLATVIEEADILSIHIPLGPDTHHFVNRQLMQKMKTGAYLINTARGGIVDDEALIDLLRSGRIAGAALDVFEDEPNTSLYEGVPNLIAIPHAGSNSAEARYRMEMGAVQNLIAYIEADKTGQTTPPGLEA